MVFRLLVNFRVQVKNYDILFEVIVQVLKKIHVFKHMLYDILEWFLTDPHPHRFSFFTTSYKERAVLWLVHNKKWIFVVFPLDSPSIPQYLPVQSANIRRLFLEIALIFPYKKQQLETQCFRRFLPLERHINVENEAGHLIHCCPPDCSSTSILFPPPPDDY